MQLLTNHITLVTGAGSGLGLGLARSFRAAGAELALFEVSPAKVEALTAEFPDALVLQGDASKLADIEAAHAAIAARFGRLDALVSVHGIFDGLVRLKDVPLDRIDSLFDELFHINVKSNFLLARVFADMLEAAKGAIVLTTSNAAYAADGGGAFYTASKGALRSLVGQLAFEFAPNVRVNAVAPAGIANSQLRGPEALGKASESQADIPKEAFLEVFRKVSLLSDLPTPEDHGAIYAFLASHENRIMTGQTVIADQGLLNRGVLTG
jgi:NAD(P)-dependent dehydrogenase (short-subunit alcohol dehydrogenase family)